MQFRCYTCGFVFHDGPPPLEALSDQQTALVQGTPRAEVTDFALMVLDTELEGLTPHNLCTPCLQEVVSNPHAWSKTNAGLHTLEQDLSSVWCTCGVTYATRPYPTKRTFSSFDWVAINRLKMAHLASSF